MMGLFCVDRGYIGFSFPHIGFRVSALEMELYGFMWLQG